MARQGRTRMTVVRSAARQCTDEAAGAGTHIGEKWIVTEGPLSKSGPGRTGKTICRSCATREGRDAIQIEKTAERREGRIPEPVPEPPDPSKEKLPAQRFVERRWGWLALLVAFIAFGYTSNSPAMWLVMAAFGAVALVYFGLFSPTPCVGPPPACEEDARGIRRRCADPDHRSVNRDAVRALFAEQRWPRAVWGDWPGLFTLLGFVLAALVTWFGVFAYAKATRGWLAAIGADLAFGVAVVCVYLLWRELRARRVDG